MIRKLISEDKEKTIKFLVDEASINLFIIGDIENYGFNAEFMEVWGSFDENEDVQGILLRYHESYICYYKDGFKDKKAFKDIIMRNGINTTLAGKDDIVQEFKDVYLNYEEKKTIYCELISKEGLHTYGNEVKMATLDDAERIVNFLDEIEEFRGSNTDTPEALKKRMMDKSTRVYYIENENGEIIASAQTSAENSASAMILSVATREDYRGQGYITKCLSKLCSDVIDEGKSLCLFYLNPEAGRIYHKLGFKIIGVWTLVIKK
ncbi:MAG: GNAT family N-acetyltransferase [Clostridium sp.]